MNKCIKTIGIALLLLALISGIVPVFAAENGLESRTVKVGYMNHPGYIEKDENGRFVGCGVEYLDEICKYTGWKIEYVYASWVEQLEMLERGELDIVPMAQYSEERAERYLFTHQPVGIIQGILVTLPEEQNHIKSNALACDGKTIGIQRGSRNIVLLEKHAEHMGFSYQLAEYDFQSQLEEALFAGEVDIIACEQMVHQDGLRVLDRFTSDPYYFITAKDGADLMEELDYIIGKINAYDPAYAVRLHEKYYGDGPASSVPYFTKEEKEFLNTHPEITLALIPDNQPLAYLDENGKTVGIIPDIMDRIAAFCEIKFNYEYVPKDKRPLHF